MPCDARPADRQHEQSRERRELVSAQNERQRASEHGREQPREEPPVGTALNQDRRTGVDDAPGEERSDAKRSLPLGHPPRDSCKNDGCNDRPHDQERRDACAPEPMEDRQRQWTVLVSAAHEPVEHRPDVFGDEHRVGKDRDHRGRDRCESQGERGSGQVAPRDGNAEREKWQHRHEEARAAVEAAERQVVRGVVEQKQHRHREAHRRFRTPTVAPECGQADDGKRPYGRQDEEALGRDEQVDKRVQAGKVEAENARGVGAEHVVAGLPGLEHGV